jgi:ABC-type transporter Mla MlaB component
LIERRRSNERALAREFAQLRQARARSGPPDGARTPGDGSDLVPAAVSVPLPDTPEQRAGTLRKIDEIEAQMALQWAQEPKGQAVAAEAPAPTLLPALEVAEIVQDPEVEEAAIRYAGGDLAGAEALLRGLIDPASPRAAEPQAWLALFDFLLATGQASAHEALALAYAERVGRSAPPWRSLQISTPSDPAAVPQRGGPPPGSTPGRCWLSPARIGPADVQALAAAVPGALGPGTAPGPGPGPQRGMVLIDWSAVEAVEDEAVAPLAELFADWARRPLCLDLVEGPALARALAQATPSGERSVPVSRWLLRLQALRVLHQPEDFELAALDYCVTYEVSPPAWESPLCRLQTLQPALGGPTLAPPGAGEPPAVAQATLAGQILGNQITDALRQLDAAAHSAGAGGLAIACDHLVRIDFAAASALLNWVQARVGVGQALEFTEVHRLVASLFHVIGLGQLARIRLVHD